MYIIKCTLYHHQHFLLHIIVLVKFLPSRGLKSTQNENLKCCFWTTVSRSYILSCFPALVTLKCILFLPNVMNSQNKYPCELKLKKKNTHVFYTYTMFYSFSKFVYINYLITSSAYITGKARRNWYKTGLRNFLKYG